MNGILKKLHLWDTQAFYWLNVKSRDHYLGVIKTVSKTGDGPLYLLIALFILLADKNTGLEFFKLGILAYAINVSAYLVLKNTFKRNRPEQKLSDFRASIKPSDQFSFPSGHTAAGFVFAALVFNFYPVFFPITLVWAAMIGCSRVLLGVHFPGDILAGICLGLTSTAIAAGII